MATAAQRIVRAPKFEIPSVDVPMLDTSDMGAMVERMTVYGEQVVQVSKDLGHAGVDAYEKGLASMIDLEIKFVEAVKVDWLSQLAEAHTKMVKDLSDAYIKAMRDSLN